MKRPIIKVEVGNNYVLRNGENITIVLYTPEMYWPFRDQQGRFYLEDGLGSEYDFDIVEKVN